jgi:hypothetical protein
MKKNRVWVWIMAVFSTLWVAIAWIQANEHIDKSDLSCAQEFHICAASFIGYLIGFTWPLIIGWGIWWIRRDK